MIKKFELDLSTKITVFGVELFRIKALISFGNVKKGEFGGYVEKEENLNHSGDAWVYGDAEVYGDARVSNLNDYIVFKNNWSSGRYFTYTLSNKMWKVGCFYGSGEELVKKAYQDSEDSGKHYETYVKLVKTLEELDN